MYLSGSEHARLTHQFLTDHPDAKIGDVVPYENRNHFYVFSVNDYGGNYTFWIKYPLNADTQEAVNDIKRRLYDGEF